MTGCHIRKLDDEKWEYPDHDKARQKCGVLKIEECIEKRRAGLLKFLMEERKELWEEAIKTEPPARNVRKVLWWKQGLVSIEDTEGRVEGGRRVREETSR